MKLSSKNIKSVNSSVARSFNSSLILKLIHQTQPVSRVKLAEITGLNKSTVSSIVSDLIKDNLVYEKVDWDMKVGRNPINLQIKKDVHNFGAINIDFSNTRIAVVDIDGRIKGQSLLKTTPENPKKFLTRCIKELQSLANKNKARELKGIGVSIAGIVNSTANTVTYAPNLGWENLNVGAIINSICPEVKVVSVENDAKASALAELWFGNYGNDISSFVFISVGPGIGGGIVVENRLLEGISHAAGEFGHMVIIEKGEKCTCNNCGCWEAYASDRATVNRYSSLLQQKTKDDVDFAIEDIIELANNGDKTALKVLRETAYYLGVGITNVIKAVDPKAIIIGGKITAAWKIIYDEMMSVVSERAFFSNIKTLNIMPSSLAERPRLVGAATIVINKVIENYGL